MNTFEQPRFPWKLKRSFAIQGMRGGMVALVLLLILLPLWSLLWTSISRHGVSLSAYNHVFTDPGFSAIVRNTLTMSTGATFTSVLIGVPAAFLAAILPVRFTRFFHTLNLLPLIIPSYISSIAWENMFGPVGFVNVIASHLWPSHGQVIHFFTMGGLIFSLGVIHYPFVYLLTYSSLTEITPDMLKSAQSSGAHGFSILAHIILPVIKTSMWNGALLAFITNIDDFGIPAFIGIPAHITVFSTQIYQLIIGFDQGQFAKAAAWSVLASTLAILMMMVEYLIQRRKFHSTTGQRNGLRREWSNIMTLPLTVFGLFFMVTAVIPMFLLLVTALSPAIGVPFSLHTMTLRNFSNVLSMSQTGAVLHTSSMLALTTGTLTTVFGALTLAMFRRRRTWLGHFVQAVLTLPYALPGMIYGLAMILAFLNPLPLLHWSLYGTFWILALAYFARFLTLSMRTLSPVYQSFDFTLLNSAAVCGASPLRATLRVFVPIFSVSFVSSFLFVFLSSLTEMTVSSVLASPGTETIGMAILDLNQSGDLMDAAVLSTMVLGLMGVVTMLISFAVKYTNHLRQHRRLLNLSIGTTGTEELQWNRPTL